MLLNERKGGRCAEECQHLRELQRSRNQNARGKGVNRLVWRQISSIERIRPPLGSQDTRKEAGVSDMHKMHG